MKLLHEKSVLDYEDGDGIDKHHEELAKVQESILELKDYKVNIRQTRLDNEGKDIPPKEYKTSLYDIEDVLGTLDLKNGMDISITNNKIIYDVYGENLQEGLLTVRVEVTANERGKEVNLGEKLYNAVNGIVEKVSFKDMLAQAQAKANEHNRNLDQKNNNKEKGQSNEVHKSK